MLELQPLETWSATSKAATPAEKIKGYSDYLQASYFKAGALDDEVYDGIKAGAKDYAQANGLLDPELPEEEQNKQIDTLIGAKTDVEKDARFLLQHYDLDFDQSKPEAAEQKANADTLRKYFAMKQANPAGLPAIEPLVAELVGNADEVRNARIAALDRKDTPLVAVTDVDGRRQVYPGADATPEYIRENLDSLLSTGVIDAGDLNEVRTLISPINGGKATVAEEVKGRTFAGAMKDLTSKDPELKSALDETVTRLRRRQELEGMSGGEAALDLSKQVGAFVLDVPFEIIKDAYSYGKSLVSGETYKSEFFEQKPEKDIIEILANNEALLNKGYTEQDIRRYAADVVQDFAGPAYRADKPESGIGQDSRGNMIIAPALVMNKALYEQAAQAADLNEEQRKRADSNRASFLTQLAPDAKRLIVENDDEAAAEYAAAKGRGETDEQFVENWIATKGDNYSGFTERVQQFGNTIGRIVSELPLGLAVLSGSETATKALQSIGKDANDRREYARLMGDEFGLIFQIGDAVPQLASQILTTIGSGALYTGLKSVAKAGARKVVGTAAKNALSLVDDATAAAVKSSAKVGGEAAMSTALKTLGNKVGPALKMADESLPLFATTFYQGATSTYVSLYSQLPETMSHEDKHRNALGYAIGSGLSTAALTVGMGFLGRGGAEDLATKVFRPLQATDEVAAGARAIPLDKLTYKQAKLAHEALNNSGVGITDVAFKKVLRNNLGDAYKNYLRNAYNGAIDEGVEEAIDTAISIKIEDAALKKDTSLIETANQLWHAFVIGGALGGGVKGITELAAPMRFSERVQALQTAVDTSQRISQTLRDSGSAATAAVFERNVELQVAALREGKKAEIAVQEETQQRRDTELTEFTEDGQALFELEDETETSSEKGLIVGDLIGERVNAGAFQGVLQRNTDGSFSLKLDKPINGSTTVSLAATAFQPLSKTNITRRTVLPTLGMAQGNVAAGTPYVLVNKARVALPTRQPEKFEALAPVKPRKGAAPEPEPPLVVGSEVLRVMEGGKTESGEVLSISGDVARISVNGKTQEVPVSSLVVKRPKQGFLASPQEGFEFSKAGDVEVLTIRGSRIVGTDDTIDLQITDPDQINNIVKYYGLQKPIEAEQDAQFELPLFDLDEVINPEETAAVTGEAEAPAKPKREPRKRRVTRNKAPDAELTDEELQAELQAEMQAELQAEADRVETEEALAILDKKDVFVRSIFKFAKNTNPKAAQAVAKISTPTLIADLESKLQQLDTYASGLGPEKSSVRNAILQTAQGLRAALEAIPVVAVEAPAPISAPPALPPIAAPKKAPKKGGKKVIAGKTVELPSKVEDPKAEAEDLQKRLDDVNATNVQVPFGGKVYALEDAQAMVEKFNATDSPMAKKAARKWEEAIDKALADKEAVAKPIADKIQQLEKPTEKSTEDPDLFTKELLSVISNSSSLPTEQQQKGNTTKKPKAVVLVGEPTTNDYGVFRNDDEAKQFASWVEGGFIFGDIGQFFARTNVSGIPLTRTKAGTQFTTESYINSIKRRLVQQVLAKYPTIPVPEGTPTRFAQAASTNVLTGVTEKLAVPVTEDRMKDAVRGVFTNDPRITAEQLRLKLTVIVPKDFVGLNPSIQAPNGNVKRVFTSPSDTVGVVQATERALSGKMAYVPKGRGEIGLQLSAFKIPTPQNLIPLQGGDSWKGGSNDFDSLMKRAAELLYPSSAAALTSSRTIALRKELAERLDQDIADQLAEVTDPSLLQAKKAQLAIYKKRELNKIGKENRVADFTAKAEEQQVDTDSEAFKASLDAYLSTTLDKKKSQLEAELVAQAKSNGLKTNTTTFKVELARSLAVLEKEESRLDSLDTVTNQPSMVDEKSRRTIQAALTEVGSLREEFVDTVRETALVEYGNTLKQLALGNKISAVLRAKSKQNVTVRTEGVGEDGQPITEITYTTPQDVTLDDIDLAKIVRDEMVSPAAGNRGRASNAEVNAVFGKIAGVKPTGDPNDKVAADTAAAIYGRMVYERVTEGDLFGGALPSLATIVRKRTKAALEAQSKRSPKSVSIDAPVTGETVLKSFSELITPDEADYIAAEGKPVIDQLAEFLDLSDTASTALRNAIGKAMNNVVPASVDSLGLIDLAGKQLAEKNDIAIVLGRELVGQGLYGQQILRELVAAGWFPPPTTLATTPTPTQARRVVGAEAASALQAEARAATTSDALKEVVARARKLLVNSDVDARLSRSDKNVRATGAARAYNSSEANRLGLVSGSPESVLGALQEISRSGSPNERTVADLLLANEDLIRNTNLVIADFDDVRFAGTFMPKSNLVVLNISGHNGRGLTNVLMHEYLHAVSTKLILNPQTAQQRAAAKRIEQLRILAGNRMRALGLESDQWADALGSNDEFVAYMLTDPEFQSLVKAATPAEQRSLFRRFVDAVLELFGVKADARISDPVAEILNFTNMFASDMTFSLDSRKQLRNRKREVEAGLEDLRDFLAQSAELLVTYRDGLMPDVRLGRRSFLDDLNDELQSEIYGGRESRTRRASESMAFINKPTKSKEDREEFLTLGNASGWLSSKGKFFPLDPSDTGLSAGFGTHQARLGDVLVEEHSEAELEAALEKLGFDNFYDLDENESYLVGYELGYARILDAGDTIYAEAWQTKGGKNVPKALSAAQTRLLKKAGKENGKTVMRDGVTIPLYVPEDAGDIRLSLGRTATEGELAIDPVSEFRNQVPADIELVLSEDLRGEAAVLRSSPNTIFVNPTLLANRVTGLNARGAKAAIKSLVDHELGHMAINEAFTNNDLERVATELGADRLQQIALDYYGSTGLSGAETLAQIEADRANGTLNDSMLADEWLRMQATKAAIGRTFEQDFDYALSDPSLFDSLLRAIDAFVTRLRNRFSAAPTTETAAGISRAERTLRKLKERGPNRRAEATVREASFGDLDLLLQAIEGSPDGDRASYSIAYMSSAEGKVERSDTAIADKLKLYNLPSQLRDIITNRTQAFNSAALSTKSFVRKFRKLRDRALAGGVAIEDIRLLFGTTAPDLSAADQRDIELATKRFSATLAPELSEDARTEAIERKQAALQATKRNMFRTEFRKRQRAAELKVRAQGFPDLVDEAVALRKDINRARAGGGIGFDESDDIYLTRTYRFFTTTGWSLAAKYGGSIKIDGKDVDFHKLRETAAKLFAEQADAYLSKIGKPYTRKDVDARTVELLDQYLETLEKVHSSVDKTVVDSLRKDLDRFKPKKDIDGALRSLLGEIEDPLTNAANTLHHVSMLSANENFRKSFAEAAIATGFASRTPVSDWRQVYPASTEATMGPLAGLYMEPKAAAAFLEAFGGSPFAPQSNSTEMVNKVGTALSRVSGAVVFGATKLGFGYWPRNGIGGILLNAAQGILWNPATKATRTSLVQAVRTAFSNLPTDEEQRNAMLRLTELGVLNDTALGREALDLTRGLLTSDEQVFTDMMADIEEARLTGEAGGIIARMKQKPKTKAVLDLLGKAYTTPVEFLTALDAAIDGAAKANAYYFELNAIEQHFGDSKTTEEKEVMAAKKIKLTFPSHSQRYDPVKAFGRSSAAMLVVPFIGWKSEMFRTMSNTPRLAMQEIREGGSMAVRGWRRLLGFTGTLSIGGGAVGGAITALFQFFTDDEEEEDRKLTPEELASLREALPLWQRGHTLHSRLLKNGKVQFVDMSSLMPHSLLTDMGQIIYDSIQTGEGIGTSRLASYVATQLIGTQIAATAVFEAANNEDDFGNPIYVETDPAPVKMERMFKHLLQSALKPAGVKFAEKVTREGNQQWREQLLGEAFGGKLNTLDNAEIQRRGFRGLKALQDSAHSTISELTSGRFMDQEQVNDIVNRHQDSVNESQRRLSRFMRSMLDMGSNPDVIMSNASVYRFSKNTIESAPQGYRIPWVGNDKWEETVVRNVLSGKEQDPVERIMMIRQAVGTKPDVYWVHED